MSDASAGVALGTQYFITANDEDNPLRIYRRDSGGPPQQVIDLTAFLRLDRASPETDLEGAARVGDRIYWITSHGQNRDAKKRPNRHRFFATDLKGSRVPFVLQPVGRPYPGLLMDLIRAPQLQAFNLAEAANRAPKEPHGLNIEGLCATSDQRLLLGFRNPLPQQKALVIPLNNPDRVIQDQPAELGQPLLLDLGGLGIRDMAYAEGTYYLIGGARGGGGPFRLYQWSGGQDPPRRLGEIKAKHLHPEAIVVYPDLGLRKFQLLSDDGTLTVNGKPNKDQLDPAKRFFRSAWVVPGG
jgi:hypothetical protein